MTPVIYHNPKCSTSRKALGMLREAGHEPRIVEYLRTPPAKAELSDLLARMNMTPRQLLRRKEAAYTDLNLADPEKSEDEILDAILAHPILMERPIVVTDKGVRLCRPIEKLLEVMG